MTYQVGHMSFLEIKIIKVEIVLKITCIYKVIHLILSSSLPVQNKRNIFMNSTE